MKCKSVILFIIFAFFGLSQKNPSEYYSISKRIKVGDTNGVFNIVFSKNASIYNKLLRGDYYLTVKKDSKNALLEYNNAFKYVASNNRDSLSALINSKIGSVYFFNDHYTEAIKYFNKASIFINFSPKNMEQVKVYILSGIIHNTLGRNSEAEKAYKVSINYFTQHKDSKNKAAIQNNLAILYMNEKRYDKAEFFFNMSLKYRLSTNDFIAIGQSYNNIGSLNFFKKDYQKALDYFIKGYKSRIKGVAPETAILESIINIGKTYRKLNNKTKSLEYLENAVDRAEKSNSHEILFRGVEQLKDLFLEMKRYDKAFKMQSMYYEIKDSMFGLDKKLEIERLTLQNQFDIKIKTDSLASVEKLKTEKIIASEQNKRSKIIFYCMAGGMVFLLYFIFQIYSVSNQRKITNTIILEQKNTLHVKQNEILDSINYAKRIQSAILPQPKLVKEFLGDSFVLYKPKDIVAGDFYWLEVVGDTVLFAAADCTGHGVPGAMVSVVCNNGLNRAVREYGLIEPNKIFDKTRELVVEEFEKADEEVKDGMDISLCALNTKTNTLKWAGANNPLWILRNSEIIEIKPDKQPIGKYENAKPFSLKELELQKEDIIYIFTDGFQDQFGGAKEKKFRVAQMRELFLSLSTKSMEEQRKLIDASFETWKGELEQVDDVCLIGVRI